MRITLTRVLSALCLSTVVLLMWTVLRQSHIKQFTQTCHHPEQFQEELHRLANRVHHVLSALGLSHFLCYGSLWGQIRISRSLPWEADVEFCLLNEELAKNDEVFLVRTFKKHNLELTYNSGEGLYFVKDAVLTGSSVQLIVFEEDPLVGGCVPQCWRNLPSPASEYPQLEHYVPEYKSIINDVFGIWKIGMLRRVGWKRRMLPPDCEGMTSLECFPPRLIAPPLPMKEFGGFVFPVPREGIEIQKYHYPDNWWKEVLPKNC